MLIVVKELILGVLAEISTNTIYSANVGLMLGHRLRRCPNINPPLAEYIVFAGTLGQIKKVLGQMSVCRHVAVLITGELNYPGITAAVLTLGSYILVCKLKQVWNQIKQK